MISTVLYNNNFLLEKRLKLFDTKHSKKFTTQYVDFQNATWESNSKKKKSKSFSHLKNVNGYGNGYVNFDASASGLQIMSALSGNLEGLLATNLIVKREKENSAQKRDFYTEFYENLIISINTNDTLKKSIDPILYSQILTFIRSDIKSVMIAFLYSEGTYSRTINLMKLVDRSIYREPSPKKFYQEMKIVSDLIQSIFNTMYPSVTILRYLLENNLANSTEVQSNKGILLSLESNRTESFYSCLRKEKKTFSSRKKDGSVLKYTHQYFGTAFDSIGCKHAISPNFIHRCDAELLFEVISLTAKKGIALVPSHDSFFSHFSNEAFIKKAYFECFIDCFLKKKFLENMVKANSETVHSGSSSIFEKIDEDRFDLLQKIETGEYVMSPHILTP